MLLLLLLLLLGLWSIEIRSVDQSHCRSHIEHKREAAANLHQPHSLNVLGCAQARTHARTHTHTETHTCTYARMHAHSVKVSCTCQDHLGPSCEGSRHAGETGNWGRCEGARGTPGCTECDATDCTAMCCVDKTFRTQCSSNVNICLSVGFHRKV